MRKVVGLGAAITIVGAVGVVTAPSVSAVPYQTCSEVALQEVGVSSSEITIATQPGDVVSVQVTESTALATLALGALDPGATGTAPTTLYRTIATADFRTITADVASGTATFTWSCSHPTAPAPIPDWIQAYGRSGPDEDCPSGYNPSWAGGPGADVVAYTKSWQQWMNSGTGGWVCTRTIPSLG